MAISRDLVLKGRRATGNRDIWLSIVGNQIALDFDTGSARFSFRLSRAQWKSFARTLCASSSGVPARGAYGGFSFSKRRPILIEVVEKAEPVSILGRRTTTVPTSKVVIDAIRRSNWGEPVILEFQGMFYSFTNKYFMRVREACIKFDSVLAGEQSKRV